MPGDERQRDQHREATQHWRAWYRTARWYRLRMQVFTRDLFQCQRRECGLVTGDPRLLVCDHVEPHRGDEARFWDMRNLQTLCKPCHDRHKQAAERRSGR